LTVLLVDDDEVFRRGLADNLRDDGHVVFEYEEPGHVPLLSALEGVSVLVTDYEMPGSDGLRFADRFHAVWPHLPVVILTAQRVAPLEANTAGRGFLRIVYKPVEYHRLHQLLHSLTGDDSHERERSVS
jgi:DNA-binding NtrC family response regulator